VIQAHDVRFMPSSFTVGCVAGIRIEIHYTWLLAFVLIRGR
jgi:hypothetical protein